MDSVTVSLDRNDLLNAMRTDCITFLSFYLEDELTLDVPEFHEEIWSEFVHIVQQVSEPGFILGHLQKLFCVPRDHAKSTLSKLAVILFMRYSPLAFTVYASNTKTVSMQAIKDVVGWLESSNEQLLYGPPNKEKANESEGLWILHIHVPGRSTLKRIILKAIGADQQVRGTLIDNKRPELLIIDDCEDLSTASSETTQARLDEWLLGSLLKATAKRSVRIMLGNLIRETTLIARLAKDPSWNPTVFGSLVRDKVSGDLMPLWKGRHTVESLLADYRSYRRLGRGHVWIHEMMNLTAESVFSSDFTNAVQIPRPNPDQISAGCIILDPALGQNAYNDESALTVHVHLSNETPMFGAGIPHVVETRRGRWTEERILDEFLELSYYWNLNTWVIESVAAQRLFMPLFKTLLKLREIPPETFTILPITGGKELKASRILAFQRTVGSGSYGVAEGCDDLFDKLLMYDPQSKDHDDLVDSASFGPLAWASYGNEITANGTVNIALALMEESGSALNINELDVAPY